MAGPLISSIFLSLLSLQTILAVPITPHESGGSEHIVIINKNHPIPPRVEEVLERLALNEKHSDVRHVFNNSAFQGFAASMKSHCLDQLAEMDDVSLVEPASTVGVGRAYDTRANAPWGLQRISTAARVGGNPKTLDFTYSYSNDKLGSGADIYVVDTGIYTENNVFEGRARMLWSLTGEMTDEDGHGTHVAGTAGGNVLGVASNANIFGVKALDQDGSGWSSNVVAAIDQVIRSHDRRKQGNDFLGSVMSMSIATGSNSVSIDSAIRAATDAGVHVVVAAGNEGDNACLASPASSGGMHGPAITVGAVDQMVQRAEFSNYGDCVDLYAPGVSIISSWIGGPNMVNALSGTSMATPHVTGIVAYAMANATLAGDPALMKEWVHMTAIYMSDGLLLANNGVRDHDDNDGMLSFSKVTTKPTFEDAHLERPVRRMRAHEKRGFFDLGKLLTSLFNGSENRRRHEKRGLFDLGKLFTSIFNNSEDKKRHEKRGLFDLGKLFTSLFNHSEDKKRHEKRGFSDLGKLLTGIFSGSEDKKRDEKRGLFDLGKLFTSIFNGSEDRRRHETRGLLDALGKFFGRIFGHASKDD